MPQVSGGIQTTLFTSACVSRSRCVEIDRENGQHGAGRDRRQRVAEHQRPDPPFAEVRPRHLRRSCARRFGRNGGRAIAAQISIHITPRAPVARNAILQPY